MSVISPAEATFRPRVTRLNFPTSVPLLVGIAMFVVAWASKSMTMLLAASAVTSVGMVLYPVRAAIQGRLSAMPRALLAVGAVLLLQGLHTVEHVVQVVEWYRLDRPGAKSLGIVSSLNVEWVHFSWNWIAWFVVLVAFAKGIRGPWMIALLAWITAHSLEHTYMLVHYLQLRNNLRALGLPPLGVSEVLPGVLGRDGWLSRNAVGLRSTLGPLASAPRTAIHFWWNMGELTLMVMAAWFRRPVSSLTPTKSSRGRVATGAVTSTATTSTAATSTATTSVTTP